MMKRCIKCVLPSNYPNINFDKEGKCNFCLAQEKEIPAKKVQETRASIKELENILKHKRGQGEYDCLLMLSGGKDSTYALYLLTEKCNLRVLAVTVDNWFHSPQVESNIQECVKRMGVDHIAVRYNWHLWKKLYEVFLKRSCLHPRAICWPCNMLLERATYEILQKYKIPLWVTGNQAIELEIINSLEKQRLHQLNITSTGNKSFDYWNFWHKAYKNLLEHLFDPQDYNMIEQCIPPEPRLDDSAIQADFLPILCYYPYNVENLLATIRDKLGWKLPSDTGGTETDCAGLQFCISLFKKIHGDLAYDAEISKMVRNGSVSREIALRAVENKDFKIVNTLFEEFGLTWSNLKPEGCDDKFLKEWLELLWPIR